MAQCVAEADMRIAMVWGILAGVGGALAAPAAPAVRATDLPLRASALRAAGVDDAEVAEALDAAKDNGLKPEDASELLEAAEEGTKKNGKIDNLGGYVKSQLEAGLRGRALSEAIHDEHAARGIGKPEGTPGRGGGKAGDEPGPPDDKGKPDDPGKPGDPGPPEGKGGKGKGKSGKGGE